MKILTVGSDGQLGLEITKRLLSYRRVDFETFELNSAALDITDKILVAGMIDKIKPQVIINCAAYTNVDGAEDDYEKAFKVNALGPRNLAIAAESVAAKLIHISTDYVFDGRGILSNGEKRPYREYDLPNPVNAYGSTKLLGENYVRDFCSQYIIIRTSWLYGENGNNFVKTILKAAQEKGRLQVVTDQIGNPTSAEDLSEHILKLALTDEYGVYHCTGNGSCTWYDFALKIVEYAGIHCMVEPVTSEQFIRKAKRPAYSCLDNLMLRNTIGDDMRNWEKALYDFIKLRLKL